MLTNAWTTLSDIEPSPPGRNTPATFTRPASSASSSLARSTRPTESSHSVIEAKRIPKWNDR